MYNNKLINWKDYGFELSMITDKARNEFYDKIFTEVKNQHCIEVGFGTGILSLIALKHNPKHITAYEMDYERYLLGKDIIEKLGLQDRITLINDRIGQLTKQDGDIVIHEIVDQNIWGEGLFYNFSDIPMIPNLYFCDWYVTEISAEDAEKWTHIDFLEQRREDEFNNFYNKVRGSDWPDIKSYKDFETLPQWIKDECINMFGFNDDGVPLRIEYSAGIDLNNNFENIVQNLLDDWAQYENNKKVQKLHDYFGIDFGRSEYTSVVESGEKVYSYTIDHNAKTITENQSSKPLLLDKPVIDFTIPKEKIKDKLCLLTPRFSIGHNQDRLILNPHKKHATHWPNPNSPAVCFNVDTDVHVRQYLNTGVISYWTE